MLRHVLRVNAGSCAIFGALFAFAGQATAKLLGTPPVLLLQVLGVGLLINACALIWTSMQSKPNRFYVQFFALGDLIWVLATGAILIGGFWVTTSNGTLWAICVTALVGTCGALQWKLAPK